MILFGCVMGVRDAKKHGIPATVTVTFLSQTNFTGTWSVTLDISRQSVAENELSFSHSFKSNFSHKLVIRDTLILSIVNGVKNRPINYSVRSQIIQGQGNTFGKNMHPVFIGNNTRLNSRKPEKICVYLCLYLNLSVPKCIPFRVQFSVANYTLAICVLLAIVCYSLHTYPNMCVTHKNV